MMKPTAVFISVGRELAVDEEALVEAVRTNQIAGAALDVFRCEPLPQSSLLWEQVNTEKFLIKCNADIMELSEK